MFFFNPDTTNPSHLADSVAGFPLGDCLITLSSKALTVSSLSNLTIATWPYSSIDDFRSTPALFTFTSNSRGPYGVNMYAFRISSSAKSSLLSLLSSNIAQSYKFHENSSTITDSYPYAAISSACTSVPNIHSSPRPHSPLHTPASPLNNSHGPHLTCDFHLAPHSTPHPHSPLNTPPCSALISKSPTSHRSLKNSSSVTVAAKTNTEMNPTSSAPIPSLQTSPNPSKMNRVVHSPTSLQVHGAAPIGCQKPKNGSYTQLLPIDRLKHVTSEDYMMLISANRCVEQKPSNEYLQLINVPPSSSPSRRASPRLSFHQVSDRLGLTLYIYYPSMS